VLAPAVPLALCLLAACGAATSGDGAVAATSGPATAAPPVTASPAPLSGTDWPTYHRDAARTGAASRW